MNYSVYLSIRTAPKILPLNLSAIYYLENIPIGSRLANFILDKSEDSDKSIGSHKIDSKILQISK